MIEEKFLEGELNELKYLISITPDENIIDKLSLLNRYQYIQQELNNLNNKTLDEE